MFYMSPLIIALHQGYLVSLRLKPSNFSCRRHLWPFCPDREGREVPICGTAICSDAVAHLVTAISQMSHQQEEGKKLTSIYDRIH